MKYMLLALISVSLISQTFGQDEKYKALFIYKFIRDMEWPQEKTANGYHIAILGNDALLSEFNQLVTGKTINGKTIKAEKFSSQHYMSEINLLFIANEATQKFNELSEDAMSNSVLIVTESPGLCDKGSMVNFNSDSERLRYEMNLASMEQSRIKASSALQASAILINN